MADKDLILDLTKKKKKTKKPKLDLEDPINAPKDGVPDDSVAAVEAAAFELGKMNLIDAKKDWPDYTYEELLSLVFGNMREKNPDFGGDKKKFVMKPPHVARAGSRRTAFTNYAEICKLLKRKPNHVLQFLVAELGTTGSIDGNQCFIVRGRFKQKQFENILCNYIKEYVTCHTCKSSDTDLIKDTRLYFLQCKTCGSRCSVTAIKTGFTALVGKRKK
uniref:Eukaryotic translation initiation factor 2 subunit 2 n=1 Tax=Panagrolaimus davidi TaxID=227884 RepID=A0A914Q876_9BILA